jgi:L-lysine exporter family protein LysE/ArgO
MEIFIAGVLLSLSLCLDLGIVNVAIIRTGIDKGFGKSFMVGLGSSFGDIFYAILSVIGVPLIFKYAFIRWTFWIGGTLILLYFCYTMIVQIFKPVAYSDEELEKVDKLRTSRNYFYDGLILALLSPTSILWFVSIGGSVIAAQGLTKHFDTLKFLSGFFIASITWSFALAFISYKGGQLMKDKIKRIFSIISALIFLALAIYVFVDGYRTLIK